MRRIFIIASVLTILIQGFFTLNGTLNPWFLILTLPVIAVGTHDVLQTRRTLLRNYPIFGHGRYLMEVLRPKIYQYFVESDTDGTPINRITRSVVYQRAKEQLSSTPFGTQLDVYATGYEWIAHSMHPLPIRSIDNNSLRINIGGSQCRQPYNASILNISAMSFGSLSPAAIEALNLGAKTGNFFHNTGEGGISPYHLKHGGDLVWQVGTGYFGCRDSKGRFEPGAFSERSQTPQIKMIEIKLSQGAKPGHGGILPAAKNTPEIAKIRLVEPGTTVESPSAHSAFTNADELVAFIEKLRELSKGKPIGLKLCYGRDDEFESLCEAMNRSGSYPDYIVIDGGEGGTGAAPLEFSNSVGMPLREGLIRAENMLRVHGIRDKLRVIASGKVLTGFDIVKMVALGADACNSARGMLLSLGCIQALTCNSNHCPTGVATQDPNLFKGLSVTDKHRRVANFQRHTVEAVAEILAAAGIDSARKLTRSHIFRRTGPTEIKTFEELYPTVSIRENLKSFQKTTG
jgi:glutamate synthase domain-containing protein 2